MGDNFDFDLDAAVKVITDDQILDSLKSYLRDHGNKPFTTSTYDGWSKKICTSGTISKRFGGWRNALRRIGIEKGVQAFKYTVKELLDNLEIVWRTLGYPPGKRRLREYGYGISERPYVNRWGSVRNACRLLAQYKEGEISEVDLLGLEANTKRGSIPLKIRWEILKRDNYRCVKCGSRPPDVILEIDHIVPVSKRGNNSASNLQTLCNRCNQGKKDRLE